jgi:sigma-B regulation protein RsbQ
MIGRLTSILDPALFSKLVVIGASARSLNDTDYSGGFDQSDSDAIYVSMASN